MNACTKARVNGAWSSDVPVSLSSTRFSSKPRKARLGLAFEPVPESWSISTGEMPRWSNTTLASSMDESYNNLPTSHLLGSVPVFSLSLSMYLFVFEISQFLASTPFGWRETDKIGKKVLNLVCYVVLISGKWLC